MGDKKKDLIPILAIALFLVIIIILCVVRLGERKKNESEKNNKFKMPPRMAYSCTSNESYPINAMRKTI